MELFPDRKEKIGTRQKDQLKQRREDVDMDDEILGR
jgi:hypothetical protein